MHARLEVIPNYGDGVCTFWELELLVGIETKMTTASRILVQG